MRSAQDGPPWELESTGGLRAVIVDGGAPASLRTDRIELVQHAASAFAPGLVQLWLRDRATGLRWPMLGAGSGSFARAEDGALVVTGRADADLGWRLTLTLDPARPAWAWHVEVINHGPVDREVDVVHAHDVALAAPGTLRTNELYVSQYLDIGPLHGEGFGTAIAVRQNLAQAGTTPWCVLACTTPVIAWATDALDVHGLAARAGRPPAGLGGDLPSRRRQHEHTLATLQTERWRVEPGQRVATGFAGLLVEDHPAVTSDADVRLVHQALDLARSAASALPAASPQQDDPTGRGLAAPAGVYDDGRGLVARQVTDAEVERLWPRPWRAEERGGDGTLLSFFTADDEHVVTRAKEVGTLRPHGTILRTGDSAVPDPCSLTVTSWMTGSPLSYLTRGHASNGRVLTTVRGYLGLHRDHGVRVLVQVGGPVAPARLAVRVLDGPRRRPVGARRRPRARGPRRRRGGADDRTTRRARRAVVGAGHVRASASGDARPAPRHRRRPAARPTRGVRGARATRRGRGGAAVRHADGAHPHARGRRRRRPAVRRRPRPRRLRRDPAHRPLPRPRRRGHRRPPGGRAPATHPRPSARDGPGALPATGGPRSRPCASAPQPRSSHSP